MNKMRATKKTTYGDSILKPGAARVRLTGNCNPFLGGTADEACIFVNAAAARSEISLLATNSDNWRVIDSWEIQTLRSDGLWEGCVACGVFDHSVEVAA